MGLGQLGNVVGHQVEDLDGVGVAVVGVCGHSGAVGSGTGAIAEGQSLTIALHQIAYGLVLLGGFSLGLASVLTSLGLAAVYGQQWLEKSLLGAGVIPAPYAINATVVRPRPVHIVA
ncbi:MAG: hypothetical protein AAFX51_15695, partial [Cyanobacteria bacterium J06636_28]